MNFQKLAERIFDRMDNFPWFITVSVEPEEYAPVGHCVLIVHTVPGVNVMPTVEHWRREYASYKLEFREDAESARAEDGIDHPDNWPEELALQKLDINGRTWEDFKIIKGTAQQVQDQAIAVVKDEREWEPNRHWITRMVRVIKPQFQRSRSPKMEPESLYYRRTKAEVLLMFVADRPAKTISVSLD